MHIDRGVNRAGGGTNQSHHKATAGHTHSHGGGGGIKRANSIPHLGAMEAVEWACICCLSKHKSIPIRHQVGWLE